MGTETSWFGQRMAEKNKAKDAYPTKNVILLIKPCRKFSFFIISVIEANVWLLLLINYNIGLKDDN